MSPQGKEALLWTVLFVPVARAVCALPAAGDSRLAHRQARSAANLEPYQPCQRRGFRRDLQLTMRAIAQTNNTMTRMQDGGLVPLFRNLSRYQVAFPDVILQARRLPGYSATLRRSMNNTNHVLNNLLYKLNLTMTVAGELGEATVPQGWTADPVPLPDVGDNLYDHYIRDFVFLHWLHEILDLLRDELVTRLERC
ncbi:PREDICTED: uncharacterized protein LOC109464450 isoform X1 [Branchiostoma belcheri]|uniref:Uncharacterized protein LOC109464450 isoform X1 n=1 Tax=Branchiostoma belcheri TaxID=7741 RepID=A0A6P4XXZ3_BRABE|nr:PREDICTED: uncharacterized protein LOC109464450 isoform X1 [Branchiostoma belcheri]